jgi:hypothetical protein
VRVRIPPSAPPLERWPSLVYGTALLRRQARQLARRFESFTLRVFVITGGDRSGLSATVSGVNLHEALAERASNIRQLEQLKHRLIAAARHQEGEDPAEPADEILRQADELLTRQAQLIAAINHTNAATHLNGGETITMALARRDQLKALLKLVTETESAAAGSGRHGLYRSMRSEIRDVTEMDVTALRRRLDNLSRQVRELDAQIQAAAPATDLTVAL